MKTSIDLPFLVRELHSDTNTEYVTDLASLPVIYSASSTVDPELRL